MPREASTPDEPPYKKLERRGEEIYDEMYDARSSHGYLSEIKECFNGAIDHGSSMVNPPQLNSAGY